MNEREFMEAMSALITAAAASENQVTEQEVRDAFSQMALSEEQYGMIRQYLKANRVTVLDGDLQEDGEKGQSAGEEGTGKQAGGKQTGGKQTDEKRGEQEGDGLFGESPEEASLFAQWEEQVALAERLSEEQLDGLTVLLQNAERRAEARNRLAEHFLPLAVRLAKEYGGRGVTRNDLAQEGNLVLLQALETYEEGSPEAGALEAGRAGSLEVFLERELRRAMEFLLEEQEGQSAIGEKLSSRANRLMDVSAELAEKLGREATAAELAEKLGLTEEEVKDVMKISLDAMSVLDAQGGPAPEDFGENQDF